MKGHIRPRGKDTWLLKYDVSTNPRRQRYATVRGSNRDAQAELRRILRELDTDQYVDSARMLVSDFLDRWLADHAAHRVSGKTFERYQEIVKKHLIPALGKHQIAKLTPLHIQEYYSKALTSGRRSGTGGLAAQTVKHHHRILSQALKQAVRWRVLHQNPCEMVDPPRPRRRAMRILDRDQTQKLLEATKGKKLYIPVLLAVTTGMRRGEILALRWRDVDLEAQSLSVTASLEQTAEGMTFKSPKTARSRRTITLPRSAVAILRRHRTRQLETRLQAGPAYDDQDLVCADALGGPESPRAMSKAFSNLVEKLGLKVRFHDLRHTHISHLLAQGVHPKVASERAGHASIAITLDVYSHVMPGLQEDAANRIDSFLGTALEH